MATIQEETLKMIKEQIGLELELCDYFTEIFTHGEEIGFHALLKDRVSESNDYTKLERFSKKYGSIRVEPSGLNRIAILLKQ